MHQKTQSCANGESELRAYFIYIEFMRLCLKGLVRVISVVVLDLVNHLVALGHWRRLAVVQLAFLHRLNLL